MIRWHSKVAMSRALLAATVLVPSGTAVHLLSPYLYLAKLEMHSDCSLREALRAVRRIGERDPADRLAKASEVMKSEPSGLSLVRTPKGLFWVPQGTEKALLIFLGQQEQKIYGDAERGVHRGDIVLDCGANVGAYTREALDAGAALIVAIEPAPDNVRSLRRNFASEIEGGKVIVYPKGVWNREDYLTLYVYPHNSGADSFVVTGAAPHYEIKAPLTTIDKIVSELGLARVDFIKMDIKGAASQALAGAHNTLAAFKPRMAISTEEPEDLPQRIRPPILAGWSGYRAECGVCEIFHEGIMPRVMFYH
jgi:FkbM family methyltransferase